ncbi:MAG: ABC transporter substrate-binding protein [Bacteroidota bacterium]
MNKYIYTLIIALFIFSCSSDAPTESGPALADLSWEEIEAEAKGKTITLMMWKGDPLINKYIGQYVSPKVKELYDITLNVVDGQGTTIVSTLMTEIEAGKRESEIDMMWINGETFFQLRQIKGLYGPYLDQLPNSQYINRDNPFIAFDFQQPIDGYECPWGNVQLALIYNSEKVAQPPMDLEELEAWVRENPGKFTIGSDFTGMTLLKSWLIHFAGGQEAIKGIFNEDLYKEASTQLWAYVNRIKPYFWNQGESFPQSVAPMHQMFANGEIYFTMSNNDAEVDNKINEGLFDENSRAYVPTTGTIQNSHYLGISSKSAHKAAAMAVINFMISPEAQFEKMQPSVWGDNTILSIDKVPTIWKVKFANIPGRTYAPKRSEIQQYALMEPAPEYMIRLYEDFRTEVIEK